MNAGPSTSTSYFYSPTIMCNNCCHNIQATLSKVLGISNVDAIAFDQGKKPGGCIKVTHTNQVLPSQIIAVIATLQLETGNHSAQSISEENCNELVEENKKRVKFSLK